MADEKPQVFPTREQMEAANQTGQQIADQFNKEQNIQEDPLQPEVSVAEQAAAEAMARKTAEQIAERDRLLQIQQDRAAKLEEERAKVLNQQPPRREPPQPPVPPVPPVDNSTPAVPNQTPQPQPEVEKYAAISQPQLNASFDVIPLPSEGKLYKHKKKALKVAFLTAADENILSNPNLTESGEFLEILINRKILEPDVRYKDLHVGDRNQILIWLRATAYGTDYPIQLYDPESFEPFEHVVDLSAIKTIPLGAEPDKEGLFDFLLPVSNQPIKFKLLTVGEVDEIEDHIDNIKTTLGPEHIDAVTYTLSKQIVEVGGNRDREFIASFVQTMRAGDSRALRKYIEDIESGVDMKLEVETPGGESIYPFLPFNFNFFWPQL